MTDGTRNIFMKIFSSLRKLIVAASLLLQLSPLGFHSHGAVGTAFTYNGRLAVGSNAANGSFDLQFRLRDAIIAGSLVGTANTLAPVAVSNGLFTVILDFGGTAFTGDARWMEIGVRTNGSTDAYITLSPRQPLLPSPYAIYAANAGTASNVLNNSVVRSLNNLKDDVVLQAGANVTITPSGNTLTLASTGSSGSIWAVNNNNATYNAGNVGIGTTTPVHRLSLAGGPSWTDYQWSGALSLENGAAIGWPMNAAGKRFGMGHSTGGFYFFRTDSNPGTMGSPALYDVSLSDDGNVGIGTYPTAGIRLEVSGATYLKPGNGNISLASPNGELGISLLPTASNSRADLRFDGSTVKLLASSGVGPPSSANGITVHTSGNVGIGGSPNPIGKLEVVAQDALRLVGYQPFLTLLDDSAGYARSRIQGVGGEIVLQPESFINGSNPNASVVIANSGNVSVRTLTIRGGADVAEPFELTSNDIAKGSVVVIDEEHAGKLKLSTRPCDTQVAGIVSGANGIDPGISLYQQGALEGGQNVALSGRVYVLADASNAAIKPGDLLTTSGTPGHAMKVSDSTRSQGAILGKAMSALKEGKGMVLVLVTLQ
jgi:hypothetical protein